MRVLHDSPYLPLPNVQEFAADGVWERPDGTRIIEVVNVGGGGGGGGGDVGGAGTNGGGAGQGGHFASLKMLANDLPAQVNVAVGAGGGGGASASNGTAGGASVFGAVFYPTLEVENGTATASTFIDVPIPDGSNVDGLLLVIAVAGSDTESFTWPSGWTTINNGNPGAGTARMHIRYKYVDGTEGFDGDGDTVTVSATSAKSWASNAWAITGGGIPEHSAASGTGTAADAIALTPTGGSQKYLWIVQAMWDGAPGTITGYPYADNQDQNNTDGNVKLARCSKLATSASDNPAPFTVPNGDWRAVTLAVPPATATEYLRANGGAAGAGASGAGGSATFAAGVVLIAAMDGGAGGAGGAGGTPAAAGGSTLWAGAGGGGGGGRDGAGVAQAGEAGGTKSASVAASGGGGGGGSAGNPGTAGDPGSSISGGEGGGGGGANAAGTGGVGGAGGDVGGGGGGGGGSNVTGGAGGTGGTGRVWVYAW